MTETETKEPVGGKKYTKKSSLVAWPGSNGIIKVGLLAVSSNWLAGCSQLKNNELTYEDYIESASKEAKELKNNGADYVIAITHSRLMEDFQLTSSVPEIDLLLGKE
jgi:5'-nucleotidase